MKKVFRLENLDCANCAAKIENAVGKLEGVNQCKVTFMTQKMILDVEEDKADKVAKEAKKLIKKLEPDVEMREK